MANRSNGVSPPEESDDAPRPETGQLSWTETAEVAPVALRMGLLAGQRLLVWTASSTMFVTRAAVDAVGSGSPSVVATAVRDGLLGSLRDALGLPEIEAELRRIRGHSAPATTTATPHGSSGPTTSITAPGSPASLRERGRELLAQSASLEADEEHPAFGIVLEQIAPDEMRVLRVLARDGDQAAVDVEASGVLGGPGRAVARRLSMLAETAGCKHPDRLPVYLDNLERLGIIRVGDDEVGDAGYEVIEAQPRVEQARQEATRSASRARLVRRRLGLTDFGTAFCATCLPE